MQSAGDSNYEPFEAGVPDTIDTVLHKLCEGRDGEDGDVGCRGRIHRWYQT